LERTVPYVSMQNAVVIIQQDVCDLPLQTGRSYPEEEGVSLPRNVCVSTILEGITYPEDHNLNPHRQENPTFVL